MGLLRSRAKAASTKERRTLTASHPAPRRGKIAVDPMGGAAFRSAHIFPFRLKKFGTQIAHFGFNLRLFIVSGAAGTNTDNGDGLPCRALVEQD